LFAPRRAGLSREDALRYRDDVHEDSVRRAVRRRVEAFAGGLGMDLVELGIFFGRKRRKSARARAVVYGKSADAQGLVLLHRAMLDILADAFPGRAPFVEVSTPGIRRRAKSGEELALYKGLGLRCWRTDVSSWAAGILVEADELGVTLKGKEKEIRLEYQAIAKAELDPSQEG